MFSLPHLRSRANRLARLVAGTDPVPAGRVAEGPVVVTGEVRQHRESVEAPLGGEEGVYARYRRIRREDEEVVESEAQSVPFVVEDDSGSVLVDPRDAVDDEGGPVVVSGRNTDRFFGRADPGSGDDLVPIDPGEEGEFEALNRATDELGSKPEWIHVQSVLRPGDEVYVLGTAREVPGGAPPFVVEPADDGTFLLSDMSRSALREQLKRNAGAIDRRFWAFVAIGLIAVVLVVLTIAVLVDAFDHVILAV